MRLHHAVLVYVPDPSTYEPLPAEPDTDREFIRGEKVGIDNVRNITQKATRMPSGDAKQLEIVVIASSITVEAQQALLKIVEEPPETTSFIFVLPSGVQLLPTLLSRFSVTEDRADIDTKIFASFVQMPIAERLQAIDSAIKGKDIVWQKSMKVGLLWHLRTSDKTTNTQDLKTAHFVATTLLTRGAANKMLLEALALAL